MDFSLIIGFVAGIGLTVFGILGGLKNGGGFDAVMEVFLRFADMSSVYITIGGTIAATIMSFPISAYKRIPKQFKILLAKKEFFPQEYADKLVEYATVARRQGILVIEEKALQEKDPFLKKSLLLLVDSLDAEKVREMLENELNQLESRHSEGWMMYEKIATYAPAFGMIGTLIGLVNMLGQLDITQEGAAAGLAAGMSQALLTTFYGSLLANLLLMPIANKLRMRHNEEMLCKELVMEGVLAINAGISSRQLKDRLDSFIQNNDRIDDDATSDSSDKSSKKKAKKEKKSQNKAA